MGSPPQPKRRQVRFVNDERFARSGGGGGAQDSWLDKNKAVVMGLTVAIVLVLIVIIIMLSRKNQGSMPPGVPAFIGGGWGGGSSVSHIGQY